jgi:hypothetical protein
MNESYVYRIRIARPGASDLFFINAMSPDRALTADENLAQHFSNERAALTMADGLVTAQGGINGFFSRLRPMLFKASLTNSSGIERVEVRVEFARKFSTGRFGCWSANPKGAPIIKNPSFIASIRAAV